MKFITNFICSTILEKRLSKQFAASSLSGNIFLFSIKVFFSLDFVIPERKDLIVCQNVLLPATFFSLRLAKYFLLYFFALFIWFLFFGLEILFASLGFFKILFLSFVFSIVVLDKIFFMNVISFSQIHFSCEQHFD